MLADCRLVADETSDTLPDSKIDGDADIREQRENYLVISMDETTSHQMFQLLNKSEASCGCHTYELSYVCV
jgi:hypothetical protein